MVIVNYGVYLVFTSLKAGIGAWDGYTTPIHEIGQKRDENYRQQALSSAHFVTWFM